MYIEISLTPFEKERLEKIKERVNSEIFWIPGLREKIRKRLIKNKAIDANHYYGWGNTYYQALFSAILTEKNPSIVKVETIIKSIVPTNKESLFFFAKNILAEKNPVCIINDATKRLIVAIIKKA